MSEILPIATGSRCWSFLSNELRSRRRMTAITLAVSAVAAAMSLIPVYVFGVLVDRVIDGAPTSTIVVVVAVITVAAVIGGVFTAISTYLISKVGEGLLASLRERVLGRALHLPISTLERVGKGDLLSRVGDDVAVMAKSIGEVIPNIVSALLLVSTGDSASPGWSRFPCTWQRCVGICRGRRRCTPRNASRWVRGRRRSSAACRAHAPFAPTDSRMRTC